MFSQSTSSNHSAECAWDKEPVKDFIRCHEGSLGGGDRSLECCSKQVQSCLISSSPSASNGCRGRGGKGGGREARAKVGMSRST